MTGVCALVAVADPILHPGLSGLQRRHLDQLDFFTKLPAPVGETGGGMANAIVGSAKLCFSPRLSAFPSVFSAASTSPNSARNRSFVVRYAADLLNGVPSIVIGIFAYGLVVLL